MHLLEIVDFFFLFWLLLGSSLLYFDYCCFLVWFVYIYISRHQMTYILEDFTHKTEGPNPKKGDQLGGFLVLYTYI